MRKYDHEDLEEVICQILEGKDIIQPPTKTVDELGEEAKERVPYILMKFNRYKP